jgi:acylglycerol lipase
VRAFLSPAHSKYGSRETTDLPVDETFRPKISGGLFLCPMLAISPDTRPPYLVELLARGISRFAGSLPLAAANKGAIDAGCAAIGLD